jgi:LPS export ABC transporter protein LptC
MFATRSRRKTGTCAGFRRAGLSAIARWGCVAFTVVSLTAASSLAESPQLHLDGMTFIASRGDANELVLHAARASFQTDQQRVFLEQVRASVDPGGELGNFEIECERGELNIETNDFEAIGNVRGHTAGGRRFAAPWVRYDHAAGLLFTNAPVLISEDAITYRGGGFRYYVRERRFRLLGGASVVQQP